ncbi:MAG: hypothetical protein ACP5T0_00055 [Verrucomicrobiia bacterium]
MKKKPTPQSYASTIVKTRFGKILAPWFGGTKEEDKNACIWLVQSVQGLGFLS